MTAQEEELKRKEAEERYRAESEYYNPSLTIERLKRDRYVREKISREFVQGISY